MHQVAAGVLRVRADVGTEQRHATLALAAAEHGGERGPVRGRRDLVEQRLQRRDPERLDALDVHERRVQRGDPLRVGAVRVAASSTIARTSSSARSRRSRKAPSCARSAGISCSRR